VKERNLDRNLLEKDNNLDQSRDSILLLLVVKDRHRLIHRFGKELIRNRIEVDLGRRIEWVDKRNHREFEKNRRS